MSKQSIIHQFKKNNIHLCLLASLICFINIFKYTTLLGSVSHNARKFAKNVEETFAKTMNS